VCAAEAGRIVGHATALPRVEHARHTLITKALVTFSIGARIAVPEKSFLTTTSSMFRWASSIMSAGPKNMPTTPISRSPENFRFKFFCCALTSFERRQAHRQGG